MRAVEHIRYIEIIGFKQLSDVQRCHVVLLCDQPQFILSPGKLGLFVCFDSKGRAVTYVLVDCVSNGRKLIHVSMCDSIVIKRQENIATLLFSHLLHNRWQIMMDLSRRLPYARSNELIVSSG